MTRVVTSRASSPNIPSELNAMAALLDTDVLAMDVDEMTVTATLEVKLLVMFCQDAGSEAVGLPLGTGLVFDSSETVEDIG
jgi:hypothetical protein